MALCWKCREKIIARYGKLNIQSVIWLDTFHCHHLEPEKKPQCWCEKEFGTPGERASFPITNYGGYTGPLNYCPSCGKRINPEKT